MSTHAICPVDWGEISMKQSVDKCKQINFQNIFVYKSSPLSTLPLVIPEYIWIVLWFLLQLFLRIIYISRDFKWIYAFSSGALATYSRGHANVSVFFTNNSIIITPATKEANWNLECLATLV